jgi:transmembrane sensor
MSIASIRRPGSPPPVSEIAADWVLRQEAGALPEGEQDRFAAWLAEDPAHVEAYEDAIWALDAAARHAADARIREMREAALAARHDRPARRWLWSIGGGAIAASLAAFWVLVSQQAPPAAAPVLTAAPITAEPNAPASGMAAPRPAATVYRAAYQTAVGERLVVTLPDGSVATLDTDSRLSVAYTDAERGIRLLRGQALFEVAHGRSQPFRVRAAGQEIVAVGTMFNVRLQGSRVEVALVEGVVKVRPVSAMAADTAREVTMRAGDRLDAGPSGPVAVRGAEVARLVAWRGGELVFNDTRLADAVAEINRYTTRPIELRDPAIGVLRISGVFRTNDPERFSQAMSEVLPVEVGHRADGGPILRARGN